MNASMLRQVRNKRCNREAQSTQRGNEKLVARERRRRSWMAKTRMEAIRLGLSGSVEVNLDAYRIFVIGVALFGAISRRILCGEILMLVMACAMICRRLWQRSIRGVFWRPSPVCWIGDRVRCRALRPGHFL